MTSNGGGTCAVHRDGVAGACSAPESGANRLLDADVGTLAFQQRVLEEAADPENPLLERTKFLAIVLANLQDFISKGEAPTAALVAAWQMHGAATAYWREQLAPLLRNAGIGIPSDVSPAELWAIAGLARPDLHYAPFTPRLSCSLTAPDPLATLRREDVLIHHPYDSFEPVVRLVQGAARDAAVERIALTLYRTETESPIGHALLEAASRGVNVDVVIEPNARRDEENNARWAARLATAGARVQLGLPDLKVHAKFGLIVRREHGQRVRYAHVSSGNYHAETALTYADLSLLTSDAQITRDVEVLFDGLVNGTASVPTDALVVGPSTLRHTFASLLDREVVWARRGEPAHVLLKVNALTDPACIVALQEAARVGVRVDLVVRGACRLAPAAGLPVHVRSIVGRFLEHSRVWSFLNGGREETYIGSADLMPRNLDRRVEVMVPLKNHTLAHHVRHEILEAHLADNVRARVLGPDGRYERVTPAPGTHPLDSQSVFFAPGPVRRLR